MVDKSQAFLSDKIVNFSNSLDSFFGEQRIDQETNGSRIKLNFISTIVEREDPKYEGTFKTKIVLPNTQKRFNIVIRNISKSLEDSEEGQEQDVVDTVEDEDVAAALRYFAINDKFWTINTDAGVKVTIPLDPFATIHIRRSFFYEKWEFRITEDLFWFESDGFGHREAIDFDRTLSTKFLFRLSNSSSWLESEDNYRMSHSLNLFHRIDDIQALNYFTGISSESRPAFGLTNYFVGVKYRRRLYKKWLFFESQPSLNWPREENFVFTPAITFKIEVIIGDT